MLKHWWERWPERFDHELEALTAANIPYRRDFSEFERGRLVLHLEVLIGGKPVRLVALFPDVYPYTRFELIAPDITLPHHQNPITKNLCLIGRASANWNVDDTLASFIQDRLPRVLEAGSSDDAAAVTDVEEHQAEPISDYYLCQPGASLLIDSEWVLDRDVDHGELRIGTRYRLENPVRGSVLEVRDTNRRILAQADDTIRDLYGNVISGVWFRRRTPPIAVSAKEIYVLLQSEGYGVERARWHDAADGRIQIIGVVFPEESAWRTLVTGSLRGYFDLIVTSSHMFTKSAG
jgi:hypothetical protein